MPADWSIDDWPIEGCHVFLSHCAEDRDRLVLPVHDLLKPDVIPWIDRHMYPAGRGSFDALRTSVLRCRHVVYFVTPSLLRQGRAWSAVERTYAELMQCRLTYDGAEFQHVELPLIFVDPNHAAYGTLLRSAWQPVIDRGQSFHRTRKAKETRVQWAVRRIRDFVSQEQTWAEDIRRRLRRDAPAREHFQKSQGLARRIRAADLPPLVP